MPQRKLKNVRDTDTSTSPGGGNLNSRPNTADDSSNYTIPYIGFKAGFGDAIDCLVDYSEPFGAHTNPGLNWAGANNNIETEIKTRNYGGTCSYRFDVGPGQLRLIGGASIRKSKVSRNVWSRRSRGWPALVYDGTGRLDLDDQAWGWRAGHRLRNSGICLPREPRL